MFWFLRQTTVGMSPQELHLLESVLDALDDLFDRKATVAAVHKAIFAACEAMKDSEFAELAQPILPELLEIISSKDTSDRKRDLALGVTDALRLFISERLPPVSYEAAQEPRASVGVLLIRFTFCCAIVTIVLAVLVERLASFLNSAKK